MDNKLTKKNNGGLEEEARALLKEDIKEQVKHPPVGEFMYQDDNGNEKISIDEVSDYIISMTPIKTIYGKDSKSESIWTYENGIWNNNGRGIIHALIEELLKSHSKNHVVNEILGKIKRSTRISREEFNTTPKEWLCLNNGLLSLKTQEFKKHSKEYYFKVRIPINYDKRMKCPIIRKFIEETFYEEDIPVIQEWIGFCLFDEYFVKKALILFGKTNTGKTVFMNLLTSFIGEDNISGLSLQVISGGNKFQLSTIENKKANLHDDISSKDMKNIGGFRMATGNGRITAEHKFGDTYKFRPFAKLTFTCNKIPDVEELDDKDSYYGRWIPIPCDMQVPKEQQDNFLIKKLVAPKELSGLFNWALEGLHRLFNNKSFSFNKTIDEIESIMIKHTDSLAAFCEEILVKEEGHKITKHDLFEVYSLFCQAKDIKRRLSLKQLSNRLPKKINYCFSRQGTKRYWSGVNINWPILDDIYGSKNIKGGVLYNSIKNNILNSKKETSKTSNEEDAQIDNYIGNGGGCIK